MTGAEPVLTVRRLDAGIGGQQILHGVEFDVAATGVTALLGRNGVGKTTTARALLGLVRRSGEIRFAGERIDAALTHRIVQRGLGYVPEDREVFAKLTVRENLELATRGGAPHTDLVERLFPELTERADQLAGTLSGGQQQMVALARVLRNDNRLLVVDEPTKGLAPLVVGQVTDALAEAAARVPVLLIEQNLQVVARLARDVVVIAEGRVVHTGPAAEFLSDAARMRELLGVSRAAA
ncbi:MAG: ABC transporter ATP-binding protein [Jatrophihabitans sp.]|nr:MAG: ABC transporter ATP-binding protein [Jatrophihabitans sp.]